MLNSIVISENICEKQTQKYERISIVKRKKLFDNAGLLRIRAEPFTKANWRRSTVVSVAAPVLGRLRSCVCAVSYFPAANDVGCCAPLFHFIQAELNVFT